MNPFNTFTLLLAALLAVWLEATFTLPRRLLGAQVDLLPALVVYAALFLDVRALALLAVFGSDLKPISVVGLVCGAAWLIALAGLRREYVRTLRATIERPDIRSESLLRRSLPDLHRVARQC